MIFLTDKHRNMGLCVHIPSWDLHTNHTFLKLKVKGHFSCHKMLFFREIKFNLLGIYHKVYWSPMRQNLYSSQKRKEKKDFASWSSCIPTHASMQTLHRGKEIRKMVPSRGNSSRQVLQVPCIWTFKVRTSKDMHVCLAPAGNVRCEWNCSLPPSATADNLQLHHLPLVPVFLPVHLMPAPVCQLLYTAYCTCQGIIV